MKYDFDELVERRNTGCVKWDAEAPRSAGGWLPPGGYSEFKELIPLWVADMDFKAAPAIQEAIRKRAEHGVFGYTRRELLRCCHLVVPASPQLDYSSR